MKKLFGFKILTIVLCFVAINSYAEDTLFIKKLWYKFELGTDPNVCFSHDGRYLYANDQNYPSLGRESIIKIDAFTGDVLDTFKFDYKSKVFGLKILPGDSIIVSYTFNMDSINGKPWGVCFYNLNSKLIHYLNYDTLYRGIEFNSNYSQFYSLNHSNSKLTLFNTSNYQKIKELSCGWMWNWINDSTLYRTDGTSTNCFITKYSIPGDSVIIEKGYSYHLNDWSISPDKRFIVLTCDNYFVIVNSNDLSVVKELNYMGQNSAGVFDNSTNYLFLSHQWEYGTVYNLSTNKKVYKFSGPFGAIKFNDSNNLVITKNGMYSIDFSRITDVSEEEKTTDSKVFPNPCDDYISIQSDNPMEVIEIYNTMGEMILQSPMTDKIDVSNFPIGLYFFKTGSKIEKFVKK